MERAARLIILRPGDGELIGSAAVASCRTLPAPTLTVGATQLAGVEIGFSENWDLGAAASRPRSFTAALRIDQLLE